MLKLRYFNNKKMCIYCHKLRLGSFRGSKHKGYMQYSIVWWRWGWSYGSLVLEVKLRK